MIERQSMTEALIVVDVQNDFCPGGALAVKDGHLIVPLVNTMISDADLVIFSQDWHPLDHSSFSANHVGKNAFEQIDMRYGLQTLWPTHCVQGSKGAEFHADINLNAADVIIRKGMNKDIDSYSAFYENDQTTPTGLTGFLKEKKVSSVKLVGLALDFCVAFSALDAVKQDFDVSVVMDACKAIDNQGSLDSAITRMRNAGVQLI
jgi:nicotinamidase/pyrazinamidase